MREASDALADALERQAASGADTRATREAVTAARKADAEAAISAADAGKPPPKPTLGKAEAKLAAAVREGDALRAVVVRRQEAFLAAVRDSHDALRTALRGELEEVASDLSGALDRVEIGLSQAAILRAVLRELGEDAGGLTGRAVSFMPPRQGRHADRDPLQGECRDHLDALREEAR